jgi:hypothetical protein
MTMFCALGGRIRRARGRTTLLCARTLARRKCRGGGANVRQSQRRILISPRFRCIRHLLPKCAKRLENRPIFFWAVYPSFAAQGGFDTGVESQRWSCRQSPTALSLNAPALLFRQ